MNVRLLHNGDGGDAIAALTILRHLGGGEMVFTQGRNPRSFRGIASMLEPLFKTQPYVTGVSWEDHPTNITHDVCNFRPTHYKPNRTLAESQATYLGIHGIDLHPWLTVTPDPRSKGKIVIARTKRYNNNTFPWRKILQTYRDRLIFLGVDDERHVLERIAGIRVNHHKIRNFLEAAQLIAGSELLISNQTGMYWLAAGMGHPLVQETENVRKIHDAKVPRPNAVYCDVGQFPFGNLPKKMSFEPVIDFQI